MDLALKRAVDAFLGKTAHLSDAELELPWAWREYEEGVRQAFLRTFEELRGLAVAISRRRLPGNPPSSAHMILAQFHRAYRDLEAVLLGVDDELGAQAPGIGEWPIKIAVVHMIGAERQFYGRIHYAVERQRTGDNRPLEMPQVQLEEFVGRHLNADVLEPQPFTAIRAALDGLHARILNEMIDFTDEDLNAPSLWWEEYPYDVRFRMHRFESHLRQHTIQVEKTLVAIDRSPTEAKRLARLIYDALAETEGSLIGAFAAESAAVDELITELEARTASVVAVLTSIAGP